jgi:uncharacterized protein YjlB
MAALATRLVKPATAIQITTHSIDAHAGFPNTSLRPQRPLLIYHSCFVDTASPALIESYLNAVGVVEPAWRYTMYRQHHYHSTTHEVLVVSGGAATLCFGGLDNATGLVQDVCKGDVIVIPAGVAHALLHDKGGFMMVGSYPVGSHHWDMCTGGEGRAMFDNIKGLGSFARDPIYGEGGPLNDHWSA